MGGCYLSGICGGIPGAGFKRADAHAADCALEPQGEGRVVAVIDARSLRLEDGREIRLAGIERLEPTGPAA